MAEQDSASFNIRLYFAGDAKFIIPLSCGDLPLGTEGRIDAIKTSNGKIRKVKIKNNIAEIGEMEFVMPLGQKGQNPEYDYIYALSGTTKQQDVYYQLIDMENVVHHEWLCSKSSVAKGSLPGTDHASKAQTKGNFTLVPDNIEKVG